MRPLLRRLALIRALDQRVGWGGWPLPLTGTPVRTELLCPSEEHSARLRAWGGEPQSNSKALNWFLLSSFPANAPSRPQVRANGPIDSTVSIPTQSKHIPNYWFSPASFSVQMSKSAWCLSVAWFYTTDCCSEGVRQGSGVPKPDSARYPKSDAGSLLSFHAIYYIKPLCIDLTDLSPHMSI